MRNIIIGTAGHVDHGKTTLIKALTGIETDRLKEEKERGMTIDLGFASITFPNGQSAGIVDVPGHERFIKNMLAGAGGVDVALLVIAADESVMPQTVEHLEILQLLEVKHGVVALTKIDTVDSDWLDTVVEDVRENLDNTFLKDAPIVPISSTKGTGLSELITTLQAACESIEVRDAEGDFRLPIDRVFSLTGFGTVVTGTLLSGTIHIGDSAEIQPTALHSRIRQIHVHGAKSESACAGTRVALNLPGIEVSDLQRGDVCASPGLITASTAFDLSLSMLPNAPKPLRNRTRIRLHIGTAELIGRIVLLDTQELAPGETGYAQFKSESPSAVLRGDRFVIRSYSPMVTIGGGVIIDPQPRRHKRFDDEVISSLEASRRGSPEEILEQQIKQAASGFSRTELAKLWPDNLEEILNTLKQHAKIIELDGGRYMHASVLRGYADRITTVLDAFHTKHPLKPGLSKEELRTASFGSLDRKIFANILDYLDASKVTESSDTLISIAGRKPVLNTEQQAEADRIMDSIQQAGFNPPGLSELVETSSVSESITRAIVDLLLHQGQIVKVAEELYFHKSVIDKAHRLIADYAAANGSVTVAQFRDITGSSRKYALPILEFFDSCKITRRTGDARILLKPPAP